MFGCTNSNTCDSCSRFIPAKHSQCKRCLRVESMRAVQSNRKRALFDAESLESRGGNRANKFFASGKSQSSEASFSCSTEADNLDDFTDNLEDCTNYTSHSSATGESDGSMWMEFTRSGKWINRDHQEMEDGSWNGTPATCPETGGSSTCNDGPLITRVDDQSIASNGSFPELLEGSLFGNGSSCSEGSRSGDSFETPEAMEICVPAVVGEGRHVGSRRTSFAPVLHQYCRNCKREELPLLEDDAPELAVNLEAVATSSLSAHERKWKIFKASDVDGSSVILCKQCSQLLGKDERQIRKAERRPVAPWLLVWPVYFWKLITDAGMLERSGSDCIHFIPRSCHRFWKCSLECEYPNWYPPNFTDFYSEGTAVVVDRTMHMRRFKSILARNLLGELKRGCNEYLVPNVLCPWGCTGYIHDGGFVSFDAIMNRFFPFLDFTGCSSLCTKAEREKVESARPDFLSLEIDMHLHNKAWSVHPTVYFHASRGPVICTCESHKGGTAKQYFHLPKTGTSLPSPYPDILSHVVLRANTLHRTKAFHYSTTYQLNKCTGGYSGLECSYISEHRTFDFISHLTDMNEARSYVGRMDIRGLVSRLKDQRLIPGALADNYAERAQELFDEEAALETLAAGATLITLSDSMKLHAMMSIPPAMDITIDSDSDGVVLPLDRQRTASFHRPWPSNLIRIHPNNKYGCKIHSLPAMSGRMGKDYRLLWTTCQALLCIPALWEQATISVSKTSQWQGFVLAYLSKSVLRQSVSGRSGTGNPFALKARDKLNTPGGLMDLLQQYCAARVTGGSGFAQEEFRPADIRVLFQEEQERGSISVEPFAGVVDDASMQRLGFQPDKCGVVLFYRADLPFERLLEEIYLDDGSCYELRFLTSTCRIPRLRAKSTTWEGNVWMRHGTASFVKWWSATRSPSQHPLQQECLREYDWSGVDVAAYVKRREVSLEKYRLEYLRCIGGQCRAGCSDHDVPLIISQSKQCPTARCCGSRCESAEDVFCEKKEEFQCPIQGCSTRMCRSCFQKLPDEGMTMVDQERIPVAEYSAIISPGANDFINECSSQSSCGQDSGCVEVETASVGSTSNGGDSNYSVDGGGTDSAGSYCFDLGNLPTGAECPGFGTGDFAPEPAWGQEAELEHEPVIPTTIHAAGENFIEGGIGTLGTSVLLNKCGTMLIRRDSQLQASRRERHMIEKVASRKDIGTVPLLYLEGILFPSVFWCLSHSIDGGILGSIPTSLFCQNTTRKRFGIASIAEHAKVRLKSVGNTASTDPRFLTFMFDSIANGALEGQDTRVVLSRGFEESMGPAGMRMRNKDDDFYSDTIDNRQCVHDLCASEREDPSTLFITLTCNQREHFGIRHIKRYVDDGQAVSNYKDYLKSTYPAEPPLSVRSEKEVLRSFQEASLPLVLRNWMQIRKILLRYLKESPEKPIGDVGKLFVRDEYQGDAGNLSHLHMLVTLKQKYDAPEGKALIEGFIRGFVDEIVGADEVEEYIKEGILENWDDYQLMKDQGRSFLAHNCSERCMRRIGPGKNDIRCRVPDARALSGDITIFYEKYLDLSHSDHATKILARLGFCKDLQETGGDFVAEREFLQGKRIYAPVRHGEGNITPVVGRLFAATRSSMNVQMCTSHGTTRYVVKYLVKIDENNYVVFGAKQKEGGPSIKAQKVFLHNTKITSSAINEKKKLDSSRDKSKRRGRAIASTEMMQLILGYPQVQASMEFVRVPTLPLGERPGLERTTPEERFQSAECGDQQDSFSVMVPAVRVRESMFHGRSDYRRHTLSQVLMLQDQMVSRVTLDRVFLFGIRPPELLFMDKMEWYFRLFERSKARIYSKELPLEKVLDLNLQSSPFVDGLGHRVRLRVKAVPVMKELLATKIRASWKKDYAKVIGMFEDIIKYYECVGITASDQEAAKESSLSKNASREWELLQKTFLCYYAPTQELPIVVFSNVKPRNASKFVIHLLLSMGHFQTERDLWTHASMKDAFVSAGLVVPAEVLSEKHVDSLLSVWVEEQLRYYPIGTKLFDDYVVGANDIIRSVLLHDTIPINEVPPVMYTQLVQETSEKIDLHLTESRQMLVDATLKSMECIYPAATTIIPSSQDLMNATPWSCARWNPILPKTAKQSQDSYDEQLLVQKKTIQFIDAYCAPSTVASKNLLIAGPPGAGKTHCLSHGILYALGRGLTVITTAMLADRAFMLGGKHLHKLFRLQVRDRGTPHRLAELAIISLQKHPEFFSFLRRLDVLFIDECGQVSAEMLSTLDIIMRKVRDSSLFMGGVLVIGTIDQVQLRPINGLPFLLSPHILTTFSMVVLKHYVRCAKCIILQEMNELARAFPKTEAEWKRNRSRLRHLLANYCTFVSDWGNRLITDEVLRIFPKREETFQAARAFLAIKKARMIASGRSYLSVRAQDTMVAMESHGDWKTATNPVTAFLNSKMKEPESLHFFHGAIYQFTHNCPGKFNATQLAVLIETPSQEELDSFCEIPVLVAPPGTKAIDTSRLDQEELVARGWKLTKVGPAPDRAINMWSHGIKARRKQYSLRHHIASTIHSAIGHTVPKIATELGRGRDLWEKAMVVVLISRVSAACDLIFVGSKKDNIDSIMRGLSVKNQYDECMNHVVRALSSNPDDGLRDYPLRLSRNPFRTKDLPIPSDRSGLVYLIVSIYDPSSIYIGFTQDMVRRIKLHNSGIGARESSDPTKRPWGLYAYVSGFAGDRSKMRQFELRWQNLVNHLRPDSPGMAAQLVYRIISRHYSGDDLRLISAC